MGHSTSAIVALLLAVLAFAAMQAFRSQLAATQINTIVGGFVGSNIFLFLLTAVSNFEMDTFGDNFQSKLIPEVWDTLDLAYADMGNFQQKGSAAPEQHAPLTHTLDGRLLSNSEWAIFCLYLSVVFSLVLLYCMNKISNARYAPHNVPVTTISAKKKK